MIASMQRIRKHSCAKLKLASKAFFYTTKCEILHTKYIDLSERFVGTLENGKVDSEVITVNPESIGTSNYIEIEISLMRCVLFKIKLFK